jgi:hypothetical protein
MELQSKKKFIDIIIRTDISRLANFAIETAKFFNKEKNMKSF